MSVMIWVRDCGDNIKLTGQQLASHEYQLLKLLVVTKSHFFHKMLPFDDRHSEH